MRKEQEQQALTPEDLDKKVLLTLHRLRGLTHSALLVAVPGATGHTMRESLQRLQNLGSVTRARLDGTVRYFHSSQPARLPSPPKPKVVPPRTFTTGSQTEPWSPPKFMESTRAGAMDFAALPSRGLRHG